MKNKKYFLLLLTLTSILIARSQETIHLEPIVISASRIESTARESGRSVTVLHAKEITSLPVTTVDELLRYVAGVNINSSGGFGVQSDIGMRGSTFSQVVILLDNMRINDPLTAHFNSNIPIALNEIEQIEVIRGAAGASFGPDAVGGIIHIKTKTYLNKKTHNKLSSKGSLGIGQYGLIAGDESVRWCTDNLLVSVGLKTSRAKGAEHINPNYSLVTDVDSLYNSDFRLDNYTAAMNWRINNIWNVYIRGGFDNRDFNAKYFYTTSPYDESREAITGYWSQFSLFRKKANTKTDINGSYKNTHDTFVFNPAFLPNEHITSIANIGINHTVSITASTTISLGGRSGIRAIESTDRGNHKTAYAGMYGIVSHHFEKGIRSTLSSRIDYDKSYGLEYLPQLSLSWPINNITLRASAGKAIRGADFTEQYISSEIPSLTPGRNIGNPDLKAERSWSIETGADYNSPKNEYSGLTFFYRTSNNLIDYTFINSDSIHNVHNLQEGEYYYYAYNIAHAQTMGLEIQTEKLILTSGKTSIFLHGSYTWLHTNSNDSLPSKYVANHPKHTTNLSAIIKSKLINSSIICSYNIRDEEALETIGARIKPRYFLLHANVELSLFQNRGGIYLSIQNLLNTEYQEKLGATMPGRWISTGIKWNL